jgi:hypothetical protein
MKTRFAVLFVVVLFMFSAVGLYHVTKGFSADQKAKVVEQKAAKARGDSTSKDANIKSDSDLNSAKGMQNAPPSKGGPKARGYATWFTADNWTPWIIKVYINGAYVGAVAPYGKATGEYEAGNYVLYARANFTDGSFLTWGPIAISLDSDYTWKLLQ